MDRKILNELQARFDYMSNAEQKIASAILGDPKAFITYSMAELSDIAGVSQGSINNFANKFSGGGFPTLKLQVAACIAEYDGRTFASDDERESAKEIMKKTFSGITEALKNTEAVNGEAALCEASAHLAAAKRIDVYGVYRSAAIATDFYYQLLTLGIPTNLTNDTLNCSVSASMLGSDDVAVAISSSGKTSDVINAVKIAKARGAYTVAITANRGSALAKLADCVLVSATYGGSNRESETEVRISQMAIIGSLMRYIRSRLGDEEELRYTEIRKILNSHSVDD